MRRIVDVTEAIAAAGREASRSKGRPYKGVGDEQAARTRAAESTPTGAEQQVQPAARAPTQSHYQYRPKTACKSFAFFVLYYF